MRPKHSGELRPTHPDRWRWTGCGLVVGVWLVAIGAILISPVGEWIIKGIGWITLGLGVLVVVMTVFSWITARRRGDRL